MERERHTGTQERKIPYPQPSIAALTCNTDYCSAPKVMECSQYVYKTKNNLLSVKYIDKYKIGRSTLSSERLCLHAKECMPFLKNTLYQSQDCSCGPY